MTITPLEPFNRDDRGYNCSYFHDRTGEHVLVYSKPGAVRGGHYHKGLSPTKNPEIVILLSGVCTLNWRKRDASEMVSNTIEGPVRIEIPPFTWHQFVFQTESVMFEMNSLAEHAADTFYDQ